MEKVFGSQSSKEFAIFAIFKVYYEKSSETTKQHNQVRQHSLAKKAGGVPGVAWVKHLPQKVKREI